MERLLEEVKPGKLITARFMKQVLEQIGALGGRVDALEAAIGDDGSVVITGVLPLGTLHIGQEIEILGRNFQFSIGGQRVSFDDVAVTDFSRPGSSDTKLVVEIPNLPGMPETGKDVRLAVANVNSFDTYMLRIEPAEQPLMGNVSVEWVSVDPNPTVPDQIATFEYRVTSLANKTADFLIQPVVSIAGWQPLLRVRNTAGQSITQVRLAPGQQANIFVMIDPIPSDAAGTDFVLTVNLSAGSVLGGDSHPFTVGQAVEPPDETVTFVAEPSTFNASDPQATFVNNTIQIRPGFFALLTFNATFSQTGIYDLLDPVITASGWSVTRQFPTPPSYEIENTDIDPISGVAERSPVFRFEPPAGAASSGDVELALQRQGATRRRTARINLVAV